MNLNRAVHIICKFFQISEEALLKPLKLKEMRQESILDWAQQISDDALPFGKELYPGNYRLTRNQHAFLTGNIRGF